MNIVSITNLLNDAAGHKPLTTALKMWVGIVKRAKWKKWVDVRTDFPSADKVGDRVIFNIKGNEYRLIVIVRFFNGHIYYRWMGTHAEYNKLSKHDILNI